MRTHSRRRWGLAAFGGISAILLVLGFGVTAHAGDDADEDTFEQKIIKKFLGGLGVDVGGNNIEYRERSPLVIPPTRDLPPPETADTVKDPAWPKDPDVKITKKKGNKDAEKDDDKQDRWYLGDRLAEASKVTELLDALGRLESRMKEDRLDDSDAKKLTDLGFDAAATKVMVTTADKSGATNTTTFVIGKQDAEKKKLNIQVAGWPRVNVVADDALKLIDRPALAYRGRRLFDTAETKLTGVSVAGADALATMSYRLAAGAVIQSSPWI